MEKKMQFKEMKIDSSSNVFLKYVRVIEDNGEVIMTGKLHNITINLDTDLDQTFPVDTQYPSITLSTTIKNACLALR